MREVAREGWAVTEDGSTLDFKGKVTVSKATGHNNWTVKLTGTEYVKIVHIKKNAIVFAEDLAANGIPNTQIITDEEQKALDTKTEAPVVDASAEANKLLGIA